MNQVAAVAGKTFKESLRDRMVLFWTYAVPLFFLLILPVMYTGAPPGIISSLKGGLTITMITFLVMTAGQSNIPGSVAADKERGLYLKMVSMPVSPWREGMGRVIATWIFSLIGAAVVLISGLIYGAEFKTEYFRVMEAAGFGFLVALSSVGIGFIIATLVKGESAATHTGVAVTLLTYFLGGMALPYEQLPEALKTFARLYPIPSANASMIQLLVGESYVGYNPLTTLQASLTVALSLLIFLVGLASYSKYCWRERN